MVTGNVGDGLGSSASRAGDIDNDGYDDIIVGASSQNNYRGTAFVVYGRPTNSMSTLDFSSGATLTPSTTGFTITGDYPNGLFGNSVSTAGDIDNDGYDDIIIGAYGKNSQQGAVYVIYGGPKSTMSNMALGSTPLSPASTGFMITGKAANYYFGGQVSTAGDINKDDFDDIIIGAYMKNIAYVIYGGTRGTRSNIDLSSTTLDPLTTGFTITGSGTGDRLGSSVSTAGDIDNDGYDDIIVGALYNNGYKGAAYVIYGGPKSSMVNWDFSTSPPLNPLTTGFTITGNALYDFLGYSVSTAGDINKDGYADIIVGAFGKNGNQGAAYVIYGGPRSSMSNWDFSSSGTTLTPSTTGFMITGNAASDSFGYSVSTAGDVNKDGYDDMIVGAYGKNIQQNSGQGAAYVIYGGPKSSMSNIDLSSTPLNPLTTGFMITGNAASDSFGWQVSTAGDINNDEYADIIVAANGKNSAYVIYASCSANCKQCSTEPVCTECFNPNLLYQSKCVAACPAATWITSTACGDCPTHCSKCISASVCTECKGSNILYQDQCLDSCPIGMFLSTTNTCEDCISHCNKCTSLTTCTECVSPLVFYMSGCFPSCPKAMFSHNNICKDCPSFCSSCTSQDSCQVCFEGFTLSNSLCVFSSDSDYSYLQAQQKATQAISSATQAIGSVICVGSAVFPFSAIVSKIVQSTRYLNLSVTSDLAGVYQTWQTDIISWDVPNVMSNLDHFETAPPLFAQYDLGSPFLVNFWPTLIP